LHIGNVLWPKSIGSDLEGKIGRSSGTKEVADWVSKAKLKCDSGGVGLRVCKDIIQPDLSLGWDQVAVVWPSIAQTGDRVA
jgi:hypothetical protein